MKKKIALHFQMELTTSYLGYCSMIISEKLSKNYWTDLSWREKELSQFTFTEEDWAQSWWQYPSKIEIFLVVLNLI